MMNIDRIKQAVSDGYSRESILVVDDDPRNLSIMSDYLEQFQYRIMVARNGRDALERAAYGHPDLILLDVLMPDMDGYETCRKLKENTELKDIPVIFMTALSETDDKLKAFQVGGVDYITKPFQSEEVQARVQAHLEIRRQRTELQKNYEQLRALEKVRDDLVHMIVHDLRSPLFGVHGSLQLVEEEMAVLSPELQNILTTATAQTGELLNMVSSILDVSKMEEVGMILQKTECDIGEMAGEIFKDNKALSGDRKMSYVNGASVPVKVSADSGMLRRVLENLVFNAIKFTTSPEGTVCVRADEEGDQVQIRVIDNGFGIPPEDCEHIFEKYGFSKNPSRYRKYSTGLGLPFCKLAVEAHGGRISAMPGVPSGTTILIELPRGGSSVVEDSPSED